MWGRAMRWKLWSVLVAITLAGPAFSSPASADGYIVRTARAAALSNGTLLGSRGDYTLVVNSNLGFRSFGTRERFNQPCAVEVERVIGQDGGYDGGIERGDYGSFNTETVLIDSPCKGRGLTAGAQEMAPIARLSSRSRLAIMNQIGVCTSQIRGRRRTSSIKGYQIRGFVLREGFGPQLDEHVRTECLNQGDGDRAEWSFSGCGVGALPTTLYLHFAGDQRASTVDRLVGIEVGCAQVQIAYVYDVGQGWDELNGRVLTYQIRHIVGRENPVGGGSDRN